MVEGQRLDPDPNSTPPDIEWVGEKPSEERGILLWFDAPSFLIGLLTGVVLMVVVI